MPWEWSKHLKKRIWVPEKTAKTARQQRLQDEAGAELKALKAKRAADLERQRIEYWAKRDKAKKQGEQKMTDQNGTWGWGHTDRARNDEDDIVARNDANVSGVVDPGPQNARDREARKALATDAAGGYIHPIASKHSDAAVPEYIIFKHVPTGKVSFFEAFVSTLSDSYSLAWNPQEVYGRADAIMTYSNTKRNMSLEIDIPSQDYAAAEINLKNVNQLVQSLYPSYSLAAGRAGLSATRINAAPLVRISWANLINSPRSHGQGLLAAIESLSINPNIDASDFFRHEGILLPKLIKISLSFTVLQDFSPGFADKEPLDRVFNKFPYSGPTDKEKASNKVATKKNIATAQYYNQNNSQVA